MSDNRMAAVCDVLGYSNLVREHSLEELKNYHLGNILFIIESSIPKHRVNIETVTQRELLVG
jgi:uncharacterized protein (UPF0248 family)